MLFSNFRGRNKRLVRKPLPTPKNKHGIACVDKSHARALNLEGYQMIRLD